MPAGIEHFTPDSQDGMNLLNDLFDNSQESTINMAITTGFCRLILSGQIETNEMIAKITLKYFNPDTSPEIERILSVFFETLIWHGKQVCLAEALLPTISMIFDAPFGNINPNLVVKFVIKSTKPCQSISGKNVHNSIARSFLKHMHEHISNKKLVEVLSKQLRSLEVDLKPAITEELKKLAESLLAKSISKTIERQIKTFIELLSGTLRKQTGSIINLEDAESDDDQRNDENVEENIQSGGV